LPKKNKLLWQGILYGKREIGSTIVLFACGGEAAHIPSFFEYFFAQSAQQRQRRCDWQTKVPHLKEDVDGDGGQNLDVAELLRRGCSLCLPG
jgi:hypothetical protein